MRGELRHACGEFGQVFSKEPNGTPMRRPTLVVLGTWRTAYPAVRSATLQFARLMKGVRGRSRRHPEPGAQRPVTFRDVMSEALEQRVTRDERCLKRGQRRPERSPVLHTGVQV